MGKKIISPLQYDGTMDSIVFETWFETRLLPALAKNTSHTVTIPGHSHNVSIPGHGHTVTIPAHTHAMEYGIFRIGTVAIGRLFINGQYVQDVTPNTNYNIANFLADPATRRISRNKFHRIEIYPIATTANPQGLTRIVANIFMQIFTNSRGSGDF